MILSNGLGEEFVFKHGDGDDLLGLGDLLMSTFSPNRIGFTSLKLLINGDSINGMVSVMLDYIRRALPLLLGLHSSSVSLSSALLFRKPSPGLLLSKFI